MCVCSFVPPPRDHQFLRWDRFGHDSMADLRNDMSIVRPSLPVRPILPHCRPIDAGHSRHWGYPQDANDRGLLREFRGGEPTPGARLRRITRTYTHDAQAWQRNEERQRKGADQQSSGCSCQGSASESHIRPPVFATQLGVAKLGTSWFVLKRFDLKNSEVTSPILLGYGAVTGNTTNNNERCKRKR
jgi:hypothetical protein